MLNMIDMRAKWMKANILPRSNMKLNVRKE